LPEPSPEDAWVMTGVDTYTIELGDKEKLLIRDVVANQPQLGSAWFGNPPQTTKYARSLYDKQVRSMSHKSLATIHEPQPQRLLEGVDGAVRTM
jgi:hypothetical protein